MTADSDGAIRQQLLQSLRDADVRLRRAARKIAIKQALRCAQGIGMGVVIAMCLWRLLIGLVGGFAPGVLVTLLIFVAIFALAFAGRYLAGLRWRPSLAETAERLDLAAGTRNQIAAALEFSRSVRTPFEMAAVLDGVSQLDACGSTTPWLAPSRVELRDVGLKICLSLALLLLSHLLPPGIWPSAPEATPRADLADAVATGGAKPGASDAPSETKPEARRTTPGNEAGAMELQGEIVPGSKGQPSTGGRPEPARGTPRRGRSQGSRDARQASRGRGDPTEGGRSDESEQKKRSAKKPSSGKTPRARVVGRKRDPMESQGSTVGQSASGGGSMNPVTSPWNQRDRSLDAPLPENPTDDEVEDEAETRDARGGAQPTLKDRRGAPSRDLSISAPGEGGDGRGGPTPAKKARGTASLVMGVPIPDFVRGLLNPGTTKVTHEKVQPVPFPAPSRPGIPGTAEVRPEPPVGERTVSPTWRPVIKKFLASLHEAMTNSD